MAVRKHHDVPTNNSAGFTIDLSKIQDLLEICNHQDLVHEGMLFTISSIRLFVHYNLKNMQQQINKISSFHLYKKSVTISITVFLIQLQ